MSFPALLRALQEARGGNSPSGQETLMFSAICFSSLLPRPPDVPHLASPWVCSRCMRWLPCVVQSPRGLGPAGGAPFNGPSKLSLQ